MEPATNVDSSFASTLALKVALQTMKERCIELQKRLSNVDDENHQLRERLNESTMTPVPRANASAGTGIAAELFQLRLQVSDLQRQKATLGEHVTMVAAENRKLWSRLSQFAKEQERNLLSAAKAADYEGEATPDDLFATSPTAAGCGGGANQNLIRSKTFTQHSPNPNLRHKLMVGVETQAQEYSMEEVDLNAEAAQTADAAAAGFDAGAAHGLGFAYLNTDDGKTDVMLSDEDEEYSMEMKKCMDGLQELRREAMKQRQELKALVTLPNRLALHPCAECAKKAQKPEMADKSLETDESLNELQHMLQTSQIAQQALTNGHGFNTEQQQQMPNAVSNTTTTTIAAPLNIIQEKINADNSDKMCPMCGKIYSNAVSFDNFREHVEMHFIDDISEESSMDRNFEYITHTVGDF